LPLCAVCGWAKVDMARRHARRRTFAGVLAILGAVASSLAFLTSSSPGHARDLHQEHDVASRRTLLAAAALAAAAMQPQAPAWAEEKQLAENLLVGGILGKRGPLLNGIWTIVQGKRINDRAVYKKDGQDAYLLYNDCGSFQLAAVPSGSCDGFATETEGKWTVDGQAAKITIKPVKQVETAQGTEPLFKAPQFPSVFGFIKDQPSDPAPAPSSKQAVSSSPGFQLPSFFAPAPDNPEDLLKNLDAGDDVSAYVRAASKGGGQSGLIQSFMKMDDKQTKIADSLEAKLAGKKVGLAAR